MIANLSPTLFAFGPVDNPVYVWGIVMLCGFALLYAREIPVRLAGFGLLVSALLVTAGPKTDGEGWLFLLILAIVLATFRPRWLRRNGEQSGTVLPKHRPDDEARN